MALTFRRVYSSVRSTFPSSASASEVAASFLSSHSDKQYIKKQQLDANQLQHLNATLSRPDASLIPENGTLLPPGYHLVYFTPSQAEKELGADGSDTAFNPPGRFTRRMWAGGEVKWMTGEKGRLKIGDVVTERTRIVGAEKKVTRTGDEMVVVRLEKTLENADGVAVVDKRNWIFRPAITNPMTPLSKPPETAFVSGRNTKDLIQTPVSLFRFSALTFNGHKIHYDREWCRNVEGHRDLVVHGPLNLIHMLDFWRDTIGDGGGGKRWPRKITYRATSPLYVGERYRMVMGQEREGVTESKIVDGYGMVGMVGRIEREIG